MVGAEDDDPPVSLAGGQGKGAGDEVRGQQVMRYGQTGEALSQGSGPGLAHGAQKGLRLRVKRRKGTPRRRGVLAAAAQKVPQEEAECGEAAHLFDHQLAYHKFLGDLDGSAQAIRLCHQEITDPAILPGEHPAFKSKSVRNSYSDLASWLSVFIVY